MKTILRIIFAVVFLTANFSIAQNFNDALRLSEPGIISGARSLAMGNAYIAVSDDFSATLSNPAGLALIKKMELVGGLNYNSFNNSTEFFNQKTNVTNDVNKFSHVGIVLPFPTLQGSFVVALGYNQIKNFNRVLSFNGYNGGNNSYIQELTYYNDDMAYQLYLDYPDNTGRNTTLINGRLNQRGNILEEGGLNNWSLSSGLEILRNLFVGGTINIYSGTFKKTRDYFEEDLNNIYPSSVLLVPSELGTADFQSFRYRDIIDWDISGVGLKLGVLLKLGDFMKKYNYKLWDNINFGATYKTPTKFMIKEAYSLTGMSVFGNGRRFSYEPSEDRLKYDISSPEEFSFGIAYIRDNFSIYENMTWIDYSKMKFDNGFDDEAIESKNEDIQYLMRSVMNLNFGFEYVVPSINIALRGGFILMRSPFKDDPNEYDKKYLTVGIGFYLSESVSIDGAYAYGWWKDYGDNYEGGLSRTYQDIKNQNIITSLKYNF